MKTKKNGKGRPRQGKTNKKVFSIRLEESIKQKILKQYGHLQSFIDQVTAIFK